MTQLAAFVELVDKVTSFDQQAGPYRRAPTWEEGRSNLSLTLRPSHVNCKHCSRESSVPLAVGFASLSIRVTCAENLHWYCNCNLLPNCCGTLCTTSSRPALHPVMTLRLTHCYAGGVAGSGQSKAVCQTKAVDAGEWLSFWIWMMQTSTLNQRCQRHAMQSRIGLVEELCAHAAPPAGIAAYPVRAPLPLPH